MKLERLTKNPSDWHQQQSLSSDADVLLSLAQVLNTLLWREPCVSFANCKFV